jgi:hypothetical protein
MAENKKKGRGGKRPGAGRKPNYLKRLGCQPLAAAALLATLDEEKFIKALLHDKSSDVRRRTWTTLREAVFGKPKQAMHLEGGLGMAHFDMAGKSNEELETQIQELESQLGLARTLPAAPVESEPEILPAPAEKAEPRPIPYGQVITDLEPTETIPVPGINVPAESLNCDKHGPYKPKSKWSPACPRCQYEWEIQNQADQQRLGSLLPGEPAWSKR